MERLLDADFGAVQSHFGPDAEASCTAMGARAYTVGNDVAFAQTAPGRATVAHELAHVLQQGGARLQRGAAKDGAAGPTTGGGNRREETPAEEEARAVEASVHAGRVAGLRLTRTPVQLALQAAPSPPAPTPPAASLLVEQEDPNKNIGPVDQDALNCTLGTKLTLLKLKGVLTSGLDMKTVMAAFYPSQVVGGKRFVKGTLSYRKKTAPAVLSAGVEDWWALGHTAPSPSGGYEREVWRSNTAPVLDGIMVFTSPYGGEVSYYFTPAYTDPTMADTVRDIGDNGKLTRFLTKLRSASLIPAGATAKWKWTDRSALRAGAHYAVQASGGTYPTHWVAVTYWGHEPGLHRYRLNLYDPLGATHDHIPDAVPGPGAPSAEKELYDEFRIDGWKAIYEFA